MRNRLPIKVVVLNNQAHGMVRQQQAMEFQGRVYSSTEGYSAPDFVAVARAYGIDAMKLDDEAVDLEASLAQAFEFLWKNEDAPALLEVPIAQEAIAALSNPFEMAPSGNRAPL